MSMKKIMKRQQGFTLIELVIAIAIIGILVAFALPAYQEQTLKARRSDGQAFLMQLQASMERFIFDNNAYPNGLSALPGRASDTLGSPEEFYTVSMIIGGGCAIETCFLLRAVPQGAQVTDGNLELHSNGTKVGNW